MSILQDQTRSLTASSVGDACSVGTARNSMLESSVCMLWSMEKREQSKVSASSLVIAYCICRTAWCVSSIEIVLVVGSAIVLVGNLMEVTRSVAMNWSRV